MSEQWEKRVPMSDMLKRDNSRDQLGLALKRSHMKGLFGVFRASGTAASIAPHVFIKADCDSAHMPMLQCNVNGASLTTADCGYFTG